MSTKQFKGESAYTHHKQRGLNSICGMLCGMYSQIKWLRKTILIDCTAGDGMATEIDGMTSEPSPRIIAEHARKNRMDCLLIERSKKMFDELMKQPPKGAIMVNAYAHEALAKMPLEDYDGGMVYIDPNGLIPGVARIAKQLQRMPRCDILVNITGTGLKRTSTAISEHVLDHFERRYWYIRMSGCKYQWAMMLGTSIKPEMMGKKMPTFREIGSDDGSLILSHLDLTREQIKDRGLDNERIKQLRGLPELSRVSEHPCFPGFG